MNNAVKPFSDARVRRALMLAVDRQMVIDGAWSGYGTAIGSHFAPTDAGYLHLDSVYPYDPDRARALLKQAGVTTPLHLQLALPPAPYAQAGGPVVAQYLAASSRFCASQSARAACATLMNPGAFSYRVAISTGLFTVALAPSYCVS